MAKVKRSLRKTILKSSAIAGLAILFAMRVMGVGDAGIENLNKKASRVFGEGHGIVPTAHADTSGGSCGDCCGDPQGDASACGDADGDSGGGGGGGGGCFVEGTPVLMGDGTTQPIENIKIGDEVMAFDGLGELTSQKVVNVLVHKDMEVVQLNDIVVTPEHRFLLSTGEYKRAGELESGDQLVAQDGSLVSDWEREGKSGKHDTYNLTVEGLHTYVAGGFRVHNSK